MPDMSDEKQIASAFYNRLFEDICSGTLSEKAEFISITNDILTNPEFQKLNDAVHHTHTSRLIHSLHVAFHCYKMCKKRQWDYVSATRGALLHDFFFAEETSRKRRFELLRGFYHPRIALNHACRCFELNDIERNCILRHMFPLTAIPAKYKEAWTVILYDKICGTKEYLNFRYRPLEIKRLAIY